MSASKRKEKNYVVLFLTGAVLAIALALWLGLRGGGKSTTANAQNIQPDWSLLTQNDKGNPYYEDGKNGVVSRWGVDLSVYQGNVDFRKMKEAGVEFAMLRLGYRGHGSGEMLTDKCFTQNAAAAAEAGMPIGVYFYSQALSEAEAEEEADFVKENLKGIELNYPVVYDLEEYTQDDARTDSLTAEQATANACTFCKRVAEAGYTPMIYTNADWASRMYDMDALGQYLIWYADYAEEPTFPGGFAMWQYSETGVVAGVDSGYVDLDLWFYRGGVD